MNIRFFSLTFLSILFTFSAVFGQENFLPGYIISDSHDTLRGFIDYRNWSRNPNQIAFKNTPVSDAVVHQVEGILGFSVNNETYLRATVQHDINPIRTEDLSYSPVPKYEKLTAFLMVLSQGSKSLYFLKDQDNRISLYIKSDNGEYILLVNYRYLVDSGNLITNKMYKEQLRTYFSGCPAVLKRIKLLSYSETALTALFSQYYTECSKEGAVSVTTPEQVGLDWGVVAGATLTTLKFKGDANLEQLKFDPSLRATGGVYLNITIPRGNRRISIYNELIFSGYSAVSQGVSPANWGTQTKHDKKIGANYIKLTNMFRYQFPGSKMKFFVNGGISNGIAIGETNTEITEEITSSASIVHRNKLISDTRKYEQGWVIGVGAVFNKISLELRREASNGMSVYSTLNSSVRRYSLLLAYRFN
jgi:hypothetical protein